MEIKLTWDLLPVIAVVLSLLAFYVPKFKEWYGALPPGQKQLFMIGLLFVVALAGSLLSVFGVLNIYAGPTWKEFVWYPLVDFVIAVLANAGMYKATNYIAEK